MELGSLQSLIGKDAGSYREDFKLQYQHFLAELAVFRLNPSQPSKRFSNLVNFISSTGHHFPDEARGFVGELMGVLETHATVLEAELRQALVKALMMLSAKKQVESIVLLPLCFKLFAVHDKELRKLVYQHIVQDIKRHNKTRKNVSLNKQLQNYMYTMLHDASQIARKKSLDVMIDLYRRDIWKDAKTVNVMAQACLSDGKVVAPALRFFIDPSNVNPEEDEEEDRKRKDKVPIHKQFSHHSKARRSKTRKLKEAVAEEAKEQKKKRLKEVHNEMDYPAIDMLYDAQGFAEKLLSKLRRAAEPFDVRLLMVRLISRCIKRHKLHLEAFYPFLQKYMQPHQEHITQILLSVVESCHELVSPETLEPLVRTLMREFVTDYRPPPLIQLGINTLREMAMRSPLALDRETVRHITQFKGFDKDKGVVAAARGVINLFRAINPGVLEKKDRGKDGQMHLHERVPLEFGETKVLRAIPLLSDALRDDEEEEEEGSEASGADDDDDDDESGSRSKKRARSSDDEEEEVEDGSEAPELVFAELPGAGVAEEEEEVEQGSSDEESSSSAAVGDDDGEGSEGSDDVVQPDDEGDADDEAEAEQQALQVASTRLLSEAEFKRMDRLKQQLEDEKAERAAQRNTVYVGVDPDRDVNIADLEAWKPRMKATKADRIASVEAGREDREGYWERKKREKESGTTNKEKLKSKPYLMARQSKRIRAKKELSMQERQVLQKKRALRRKGKRFMKGNGLNSNRKLNAVKR